MDRKTDRVVVLDNGAHSCKVGVAYPDVGVDSEGVSKIDNFGENILVIPNQIVKSKKERKTFIGDQITSCRDTSKLTFHRPCERGYVTNWDIEEQIWTRIFGKHVLKVDPNECGMLLTEPFMNPKCLASASAQMAYETFGFQSLATTSASFLGVFNQKMESPKTLFAKSPACLVVDSGYSFTHVAPFFGGHLIEYALKRVNVGGKVLTNYLKELISFRQWNMMDETHLVQHVKEKLCFVTNDLQRDLNISAIPRKRLGVGLVNLENKNKNKKENTIVREFVLPDYVHSSSGYIRTEENLPIEGGAVDDQVLVMNSERFMVPEVLFSPTDAGLEQAGVAEAVIQSIEACHADIHPFLYSNILVVGGNANIPGFKERLYREIRALAPADFEVKLVVPDRATEAPWRGGMRFVRHPDYAQRVVTKAEYLEHGYDLCYYRWSH